MTAAGGSAVAEVWTHLRHDLQQALTKASSGLAALATTTASTASSSAKPDVAYVTARQTLEKDDGTGSPGLSSTQPSGVYTPDEFTSTSQVCSPADHRPDRGGSGVLSSLLAPLYSNAAPTTQQIADASEDSSRSVADPPPPSEFERQSESVEFQSVQGTGRSQAPQHLQSSLAREFEGDQVGGVEHGGGGLDKAEGEVICPTAACALAVSSAVGGAVDCDRDREKPAKDEGGASSSLLKTTRVEKKRYFFLPPGKKIFQQNSSFSQDKTAPLLPRTSLSSFSASCPCPVDSHPNKHSSLSPHAFHSSLSPSSSALFLSPAPSAASRKEKHSLLAQKDSNQRKRVVGTATGCCSLVSSPCSPALRLSSFSSPSPSFLSSAEQKQELCRPDEEEGLFEEEEKTKKYIWGATASSRLDEAENAWFLVDLLGGSKPSEENVSGTFLPLSSSSLSSSSSANKTTVVDRELSSQDASPSLSLEKQRGLASASGSPSPCNSPRRPSLADSTQREEEKEEDKKKTRSVRALSSEQTGRALDQEGHQCLSRRGVASLEGSTDLVGSEEGQFAWKERKFAGSFSSAESAGRSHQAAGPGESARVLSVREEEEAGTTDVHSGAGASSLAIEETQDLRVKQAVRVEGKQVKGQEEKEEDKEKEKENGKLEREGESRLHGRRLSAASSNGLEEEGEAGEGGRERLELSSAILELSWPSPPLPSLVASTVTSECLAESVFGLDSRLSSLGGGEEDVRNVSSSLQGQEGGGKEDTTVASARLAGESSAPAGVGHRLLEVSSALRLTEQSSRTTPTSHGNESFLRAEQQEEEASRVARSSSSSSSSSSSCSASSSSSASALSLHPLCSVESGRKKEKFFRRHDFPPPSFSSSAEDKFVVSSASSPVSPELLESGLSSGGVHTAAEPSTTTTTSSSSSSSSSGGFGDSLSSNSNTSKSVLPVSFFPALTSLSFSPSFLFKKKVAASADGACECLEVSSSLCSAASQLVGDEKRSSARGERRTDEEERLGCGVASAGSPGYRRGASYGRHVGSSSRGERRHHMKKTEGSTSFVSLEAMMDFVRNSVALYGQSALEGVVFLVPAEDAEELVVALEESIPYSWRDVEHAALEALKPLTAVVVGRLVLVELPSMIAEVFSIGASTEAAAAAAGTTTAAGIEAGGVLSAALSIAPWLIVLGGCVYAIVRSARALQSSRRSHVLVETIESLPAERRRVLGSERSGGGGFSTEAEVDARSATRRGAGYEDGGIREGRGMRRIDEIKIERSADGGERKTFEDVGCGGLRPGVKFILREDGKEVSSDKIYFDTDGCYHRIPEDLVEDARVCGSSSSSVGTSDERDARRKPQAEGGARPVWRQDNPFLTVQEGEVCSIQWRGGGGDTLFLPPLEV